MKKAQVTLFIIIGVALVILLGVMLYYFYTSSLSNLKETNDGAVLELQANQIKEYVEKCLLDAGMKGSFLIGAQGGYIDPDYNEYYGNYDQVPFKKSGVLKIPYWYANGKNISPTLEQVETKLGRYILVSGENCTEFDDFTSFEGTEIIKTETNYRKNYFDFSIEKSHINVSANDNDISIKYYYPITLKRKDAVKTISEFYVNVPIALGADFKMAKLILQKMIENKDDYNMENDCRLFDRDGWTNVFPQNYNIVIIDYEPYMNPNLKRSFKMQFGYSDLVVYGYCSP